ncbi:VOC family protein [Halobacillus litoralis]|uniref:VOC family protein n=1 Tax=Halobacillus litoralis TaxID=45668 RepID=UPI001CFED99E|nr:VOC family protein [Halobacillus litoralis]
MRNKIQSCFIHLVHFEESKAWYKEVLGFSVLDEGEGYVKFQLEGPDLILLQAQVDAINPLPYAPFFFETDELEADYARLKAKGVKVEQVEHFGGSMYGCHFYDPEGNRLLVCTADKDSS